MPSLKTLQRSNADTTPRRGIRLGQIQSKTTSTHARTDIPEDFTLVSDDHNRYFSDR